MAKTSKEPAAKKGCPINHRDKTCIPKFLCRHCNPQLNRQSGRPKVRRVRSK